MYPISISMDSSTDMSIVEKAKSSERNKNIAIKFQNIKELVKTVVVNVYGISTEVQPADVLTKESSVIISKYCDYCAVWLIDLTDVFRILALVFFCSSSDMFM